MNLENLIRNQLKKKKLLNNEEKTQSFSQNQKSPEFKKPKIILPSFKTVNLVYDTESQRFQLHFSVQENGDNDEKLNEIHSKLYVVVQYVENNEFENVSNWNDSRNVHGFKRRLNEVLFENDKQKGKYKLAIDKKFMDNDNRYIHVRAKLEEDNSNSGEWCNELFYMFEPESHEPESHDISINLQFENEQQQKINLKQITIENLRTFIITNFWSTPDDVLNIDVVSLHDKNDIKLLNVQDDNMLSQLQNVDKLLFKVTKKPKIQIPEKIILRSTYNNSAKQMVLTRDEGQYNIKALKAKIQDRFKLKNDNVSISTMNGTPITKDEHLLQHFVGKQNQFVFQELE